MKANDLDASESQKTTKRLKVYKSVDVLKEWYINKQN